MAAQIRVVEEVEAGENALAGAPLSLGVPPEAPKPSQEVVAAFQLVGSRLAALETAVQGVPKAIGYIRTILRALGARTLMALAVVGCLGLAAAAAYHPSWEGLGIFVAFALLVYLPMAYLASKGN